MITPSASEIASRSVVTDVGRSSVFSKSSLYNGRSMLTRVLVSGASKRGASALSVLVLCAAVRSEPEMSTSFIRGFRACEEIEVGATAHFAAEPPSEQRTIAHVRYAVEE